MGIQKEGKKKPASSLSLALYPGIKSWLTEGEVEAEAEAVARAWTTAVCDANELNGEQSGGKKDACNKQDPLTGEGFAQFCSSSEKQTISAE